MTIQGFTLRSVPELAPLSPDHRRILWHRCTRLAWKHRRTWVAMIAWIASLVIVALAPPLLVFWAVMTDPAMIVEHPARIFYLFALGVSLLLLVAILGWIAARITVITAVRPHLREALASNPAPPSAEEIAAERARSRWNAAVVVSMVATCLGAALLRHANEALRFHEHTSQFPPVRWMVHAGVLSSSYGIPVIVCIAGMWILARALRSVEDPDRKLFALTVYTAVWLLIVTAYLVILSLATYAAAMEGNLTPG